MYKGHPAAGPQTSLRLDRRVVRHEFRGRAAVRAEDACRDERESQIEKSAKREATRYTNFARADHAHGEVTHASESIVVFLVVATRLARQVDLGCSSSSIWLTFK